MFFRSESSSHSAVPPAETRIILLPENQSIYKSALSKTLLNNDLKENWAYSRISLEKPTVIKGFRLKHRPFWRVFSEVLDAESRRYRNWTWVSSKRKIWLNLPKWSLQDVAHWFFILSITLCQPSQPGHAEKALRLRGQCKLLLSRRSYVGVWSHDRHRTHNVTVFRTLPQWLCKEMLKNTFRYMQASYPKVRPLHRGRIWSLFAHKSQV